MNVLYITPDPSLFGANKSLITLMKELKNRYEVNPILLVSNKSKNKEYMKFKEICNIEGITVLYLKFYDWQCDCNIAKIKDSIKKILNMILFRRMCFKLKGYQFNIVHTNTSVTHLGQLLADKYHIPHIWHIREFGKEDYNLRYIYHKSYVGRMYQKADIVIAISNSIRQKIKNLAPEANSCLIYNGIYDTRLLIKKDVDLKCIKFCCVGRISSGKNQFEIVRAVQILKGWGITNFKVYFAGAGDEAYLNRTKHFIQDNDLEQNISFLGYRNDIFKLLESMDIGIVSSVMEAFGRVTIEYMMAQMPVIGSDTGGTKELLQNTSFGFLYECGRPEKLAGQMSKFVKNPCIIRSLGKEAQKTAEELYGVNKNTDKIYECYLGACKQQNITVQSRR